MRKFIVSDLYGDKEMYDIILSYLEDLDEEVLLVLNGNMIGLELDIYQRIKNGGNIKIEYLGGNLELDLYQRLNRSQFKEFLGNLNTFHLFEEGIYHRPFLVAHGDIPKDYYFPSKIQDNDSKVFDIVNRRMDLFDRNFATRQYMGAIAHYKYSNPCFIFIRGGVPIKNEDGFFYNSCEHTFTIDGGCNYYLEGDKSFDHVPLVEIEDGNLCIRVFNHDGYIIHEYLFNGKLEEKCKIKIKELHR